MADIWVSIQFLKLATCTYTAGRLSLQPIPQDTIPDCTYLLSLPTGQTNGAPPSPWHVSTPGCPPAQMNEGSNRNRGPRRVACRVCWHMPESTTGNSTRFIITLYLPAFPNTSFPQPEATHVFPVLSWPCAGKQMVLMCSASPNGLSNTTSACKEESETENR